MVSEEGGFVRRPSSRRISRHNLASKNILGGNRSTCDRRQGAIVVFIGKSFKVKSLTKKNPFSGIVCEEEFLNMP
jgi:hypothetical protein